MIIMNGSFWNASQIQLYHILLTLTVSGLLLVCILQNNELPNSHASDITVTPVSMQSLLKKFYHRFIVTNVIENKFHMHAVPKWHAKDLTYDEYQKVHVVRRKLSSLLITESHNIFMNQTQKYQSKLSSIKKKENTISVSESTTFTSTTTTNKTIVFYAIGDQPYKSDQFYKMKNHLLELPIHPIDATSNATFLIHVGDIRRGKGNICTQNEFTSVSTLLQSSPIPVFIIPGDNEWTECSNWVNSQQYWRNEFLNFTETYWLRKKRKLVSSIQRNTNHKEIFHFVLNDILFIGLNIVGGSVHPNRAVWDAFLIEQYGYVEQVIVQYNKTQKLKIGRIVIFMHAIPSRSHNAFFNPFKAFVTNVLNNTIPILLIHGDVHKWIYEPNFLGLKSVLRISLVSEAKERPLQLKITSTGTKVGLLSEAFSYQRR